MSLPNNKEDSKMNLGEKIKECRKQAGFSQEQLAERQIVYLVAIVAYIVYFVICHKILMIGFLVATLFMLFFELRIFMCKGETNETTCDRYTKRNNR